ncbi:L-aminoadipate-semialdehyde dehydrogenase-phosphopantetheinyl transferase [Tetrabaena socialis]|uniref:holo-[acyl-carrier-protein] synthase n=1 Tax=Tetrabaena socialis TaxID=47790 RepID=A0A2J8A960_9CHLO|nr:L-aminoadipate-semialdehyde dehydrogenase-phosphopantetheinyl transferase [Tetrabaena socialis]|eukprot:PNH09074.1 L-aminoadipate-semialdehyde dehydrogenase-phosphopantetheinyl transferase [Tetrabaena socialis]
MSPLARGGGHRFRWVLDVDEEMALGFQRHLALLPEPEQRHVLSFVQPADQHRALASRLMQRACVCLALAVEWPAVTLALTKGRKPFTTCAKPSSAPNFNYNVSHEGLAHDEAACEAAFQRLWSLKEAYIKARGDGLGFAPLSRAAFHCAAAGRGAAVSAELMLDGAPQPNWRFLCEPLPYGHCVSVALGPPSGVVDQLGAFKATLHGAPDPGAAAAGPSFTAVTLEQLLAAAGVV